MLPFRKILFPVDYSAPCQSIVPHVRDAVTHFGAELTLVHAHVPLPMWYGEYALAGIVEPAKVRVDEEEELQRFAAGWFPNMPVNTIVEVGEPGTAIHEVVKRQGADLVMMPTHGHGPLRKLLLGSVTAKVLHDVSCAVWTGASGIWEGHRPAVRYRSVLCALDQSEEAVAVLRAAAAIAKSYQAQLYLYHAAQTPPPSGELDVFTYSKEIVESANAWLRELKAGEGIDAPHAVADRAVGPGVREEALRRKADLIVVGRGNAQGAVSRLWSNLYAVVREAPCPVLSI